MRIALLRTAERRAPADLEHAPPARGRLVAGRSSSRSCRRCTPRRARRTASIPPAGTASTSSGSSSTTERPTTTSGAVCLSGVADPTPIPAAPESRDGMREAEGEVSRLMSVQATAALGTLARNHHVTLGAIVGAAWSVVLAHHSGRSDIVFGASFAGRPDGVPGIETMVGPCVNNLPIRVRVDERTRVGEWLRDVHALMGELTQYQTTPLARIHALQRRADVAADVRQPARGPELHRRHEGRVARRGPAASAPVSRIPASRAPTGIDQLPGHRSGPARRAAGDPGAGRRRALRRRLGCRRGRRSGQRAGRAGRVEGRNRVGAACQPAGGNPRARPAGRPPNEGAAAGRRLAPRTEMEKALVDIWRQLFDGEIGTDENYFELGAHSLMLVRAHERISSDDQAGSADRRPVSVPDGARSCRASDGEQRPGPPRRGHPGAREEPAARRGTAQGAGRGKQTAMSHAESGLFVPSGWWHTARIL